MRRLFPALLALAPITAQAEELRFVEPLTSLLLPFNTGGGGGGLPTGTPGGVIYYTSPTIVQSSGVLGAGQLVVGGGSGGAPTSEAQCTLAQGCLGGSQAAATSGQVPVFPGSGGAAVPTSLGFSSLTGSVSCAQLPALTGDVTTAGAVCTTVVGNIPTGVTVAGTLVHTQITAPSSPAAGKLTVWADSTNSAVLSTKNNAGTVSNTVQPISAVSHQFLTAIAGTGVVSQAQPAFGDLAAGTATCAQLPALTGDVTTTAGTCATTVAAISTNGAPVAGALVDTQIAAPAAPAAGKLTVWADTTNTAVLSTKNNAGTVSNTVQPFTAPANQFVTAISGNGVVSASTGAMTIAGATVNPGGTYAPFRSGVTPSNPTGTASTAAFTMAGLAIAFTPATSGRIQLIVVGNSANTVGGDGCAMKLMYAQTSITAAPSNGAAQIGTLAGGQITPLANAAANTASPFADAAQISGLNIGQAYWVDIAQIAIPGGTCSFSSLSFSIFEL